jgi:hypothetical protein
MRYLLLADSDNLSLDDTLDVVPLMADAWNGCVTLTTLYLWGRLSNFARLC